MDVKNKLDEQDHKQNGGAREHEGKIYFNQVYTKLRGYIPCHKEFLKKSLKWEQKEIMHKVHEENSRVLGDTDRAIWKSIMSD